MVFRHGKMSFLLIRATSIRNRTQSSTISSFLIVRKKKALLILAR